ncbi:MAG: glycosyltransferase family 8 protein [Terricaulis sp.]
MSDQIDIAFGFDTKYARHAAAVLASIARYTDERRVRLLMVHAGVDEALRAQVESVAPKANFVWIEVGDDDLPAYADRGHLNRTVLFRLGLEKLAPADCKRVIYIDADTIVLRDIRELWNTDLGENALGAALDAYVDADHFARLWSLPVGASRYFNAGIQLINLERVRAERLFSAALDFIGEHDAKLLFGDQDALNYVFWGKWTRLDPAWNVQRFLNAKELAGEIEEERRVVGGPALVHFIGTEKPWMPNVWHPWAWIYWDNIERTPFAAEVARDYGMNLYQLTRLRLRWWLRRPNAAGALSR